MSVRDPVIALAELKKERKKGEKTKPPPVKRGPTKKERKERVKYTGIAWEQGAINQGESMAEYPADVRAKFILGPSWITPADRDHQRTKAVTASRWRFADR